ncbi:MAG: imidazolonepropionase [Candidatus Izemoplasmatales bacterium]
MYADQLFVNIQTLYTPHHQPPVRKEQLKDILAIDHASIAVSEGKIIAFGELDVRDLMTPSTKIIDCAGKICIPGLIDSHTHLVHAGSREQEAMMIMEGVPYMDILKQGGGIHATVLKTREATKEELIQKAERALSHMLSLGVTVLEAKSGYGLDFETEIKQLEVAKELSHLQPIELYSTFLGAHALPKEYEHDRQAYLEIVLQTMDEVAKRHLAEFVDVFLEEGAFNQTETEMILSRAQENFLKIRLHADEIATLHGAALGVRYQAASVDHLMAIAKEDIPVLASSNTIANLLPATSFFLNKEFAPARTLIDQGCALAISSDYNPGSAPSESFPFAMKLAFHKMKMHPYEILSAATINPAYSLGISDRVGSIEVGKQADLVFLDAPNLAHWLMNFGFNPVKQVYKKGKLVVHQLG